MKLSFTTWEFHSSVSQNDPCIYEYSSMIKKIYFPYFYMCQKFQRCEACYKASKTHENKSFSLKSSFWKEIFC